MLSIHASLAGHSLKPRFLVASALQISSSPPLSPPLSRKRNNYSSEHLLIALSPDTTPNSVRIAVAAAVYSFSQS